MSSLQPRLDKNGLPIPATFEDRPDDDARQPRHVTAVRLSLMLVGAGLLLGIGIKWFKDQGPEVIAAWYSRRAADKHLSEDLTGAVADLDEALKWLPEDPYVVYQRAIYRLDAHDLQGSLADFDHLIQLSPKFADAYTRRSTVYQRMGEHRKAIDDLNLAIQLRPGNDHQLLNHRAYTRAIAGVELEEALVDIDRAIELVGVDNSAYLDTRGYVLFGLERYEEAMADMEKAVQMTVEQRDATLGSRDFTKLDHRRQARIRKMFNEMEAVLIYHRGQIHEQLGNDEAAATDKQRGIELGYNPEKGVY